MNEFRCSLAELQILLKHYDHVLILSTVLCQVNLGYLYHHLWSETQKTGYSMGVAVRLELALDLDKKMEQAKESTLKKFPKTFKVDISSNSLGKTSLTKWR